MTMPEAGQQKHRRAGWPCGHHRAVASVYSLQSTDTGQVTAGLHTAHTAALSTPVTLRTPPAALLGVQHTLQGGRGEDVCE